MATFVARITVDSRGTRHDFGGKIMAGIIKVTKDIQENDAKRKAVVLSNTISHKYDKYLTNNSYLLDVDEDQRINVVLYERKSGGYGVRVQGTNVLYYEYGTGTRGDMNKHPKKPDRLKGYGTGKYILQHGEYKNNHSDNKPPSPQWYPFDKNGNIKKQNYKMATARTDSALGGVKNIKFSDMVWKHAGVITLGAPAGKFIYESVELFKKNFGEEAGMIAYKKSISVRIKNSIQNELKRWGENMNETLLYQLRDDLETLFSTDTDYPNMVVKTSYDGDDAISYPYIVVEELDNSDVEKFYDGREHVVDVGYQFTIFAEQTEDKDAKTNVRMIIDKIREYMRGERYHSLHRIGSSPDAALPNDSNVRIGYMRYNGRIDIDTNTIYRRN